MYNDNCNTINKSNAANIINFGSLGLFINPQRNKSNVIKQFATVNKFFIIINSFNNLFFIKALVNFAKKKKKKGRIKLSDRISLNTGFA